MKCWDERTLTLAVPLSAVDCWDGRDEEPIVYHGNTLTSRTPLADVMKTIGDYAFEVSE